MALSTREPSRPVVGATRARQGRFGRHVFWVLLFGTLLAALGLFAAWTWRSGDLATTRPGPRAPEEAAVFRAPEPAAINPQPGYQEGLTPEAQLRPPAADRPNVEPETKGPRVR